MTKKTNPNDYVIRGFRSVWLTDREGNKKEDLTVFFNNAFKRAKENPIIWDENLGKAWGGDSGKEMTLYESGKLIRQNKVKKYSIGPISGELRKRFEIGYTLTREDLVEIYGEGYSEELYSTKLRIIRIDNDRGQIGESHIIVQKIE